jgi:hypothetical protein
LNVPDSSLVLGQKGPNLLAGSEKEDLCTRGPIVFLNIRQMLGVKFIELYTLYDTRMIIVASITF